MSEDQLTTMQKLWCDHTFNPWRGCTKVAAGCANCYAESLSKRNPGTLGTWGDHGTRVLASENYWLEPIKWNREAERAGVRARVFCASLADVFEDWQGEIRDHKGNMLWGQGDLAPDESPITIIDIRRRLFALIDATPHLDWLLLTKRPENIRRMWPDLTCEYCDQESCGVHRPGCLSAKHRPNVWLGTSISTQADAEKNVYELLKCNDLCPVKFVSAEPLLEPINLRFLSVKKDAPHYDALLGRDELDWVTRGFHLDWLIIGGESGPHARPCDVAWIRSLKDQAQAAGAPVFVKQMGANIIDRDSTAACSFPDRMCWPDGTRQDGQRIILADPKGGDTAEWPEDLRVRQFPAVETNQ